jgi:nucleotide-binding universal stress UspA family protein
MKKIILAFDGTNFSEGAFEFARRLNEVEPILLTGAFMPQTQLSSLWSYANDEATIPLVENEEAEIIQKNITRFENLCQKNGIEYRVHKDYFDFVIPELKKESLYADLLILGSEVFYEDAKGAPAIYLEEALHNIKCPVLVVPEKFDFPQNIILAYDGNDESVFAIKQFAYLFPELTKLKTLLVYAHRNADKDIPDRIQMEELVTRHFPDLTLFKLNINPKAYFNTWIMDNRSALLVSGSYSRSGLSRLFKKSFLKEVIADHRLPVFIAHR